MFKFLCTLPLLLLFILPAQAATNSPYVAKAEQYLQAMRQAKAQFQLIAPDQTMRTGTFYLKRPGRLRFEYDQSPKDLIVADGTLLHYYDAGTRQTQSAPIQSTLANFFLRSNMKFTRDLNVQNVEEDTEYVHITLVQKKDPESGNITLSFSKAPFEFKGWRVAEYNGNVTRVRLRNIQINPDLPASLFVFKDPSGKGRVNQ